MKIGILTYHRAENYGAELQAVALRTTLEYMGHEAYFIDYYPEYHKKSYALPPIPWRNITKHPLSHISFIKDYIYKSLRKRNFKVFQKKYIDSHCTSLNDNFDIIIYGSDQIWRKQRQLNDYNPIYFGLNNIKTQKHISYAASADIIPETKKDKIRFQQLLKHLDSISVRETTLQNSIKELGFNSVVSLDPAFLLSKDEWTHLLNLKKTTEEKYLLIYDLIGIINFQDVNIKAREYGLNVKKLTGGAYIEHKKTADITAGPLDFIEMIMNAECVLASSFHGLVFSLIFQKPVLVTTLPQINGRIRSLLELINHPELYVDSKEISTCIPHEIDYTDINKRLSVLKDSSMEYLNKTINCNL